MTDRSPNSELVTVAPVTITRSTVRADSTQEWEPINPIRIPCAIVRNTPVFPIQSETVTKIAPALAKAQRKFKLAKKDTENPGYKAPNGHTPKYADLASVHEACMEALNSEGLFVVHRTVPIADELFLLTTLFHDSGEWFQSAFPLSTLDSVRTSIAEAAKTSPVTSTSSGLDATPAGGEPAKKKRNPGVQALGSEITYLRRYCLAALVAVASGDEDDDGNAAQAHVAARSTQARVSKPTSGGL